MTQRAMVGNAADEKQVGKAKEKELRGRERELNDVRIVGSTVEGRRLLWRQLEFYGVHRTPFAHDDSRTNFNAGLQSAGHWLLAQIVEADEEIYFTMMREAQKEKLNNAG